jgi:putative ATP-dependent endonuclease of OLD family
MTQIEKSLKANKGKAGADFADLTKAFVEARENVLGSVRTEIDSIQNDLTTSLQEVFPHHQVVIDGQSEVAQFDATSLFKSAKPLIRVGTPAAMNTLARQGSGAQRALMWAALRVLANRAKTSSGGERPRLLLIDEPELCLHPSTIRAASHALYELAEADGWQVMVTTHSPLFIDLGRDHTTIVRLERGPSGIEATRVFRADDPDFKEVAKTTLKLLNAYDPYVGEFFFGGKTILVEGDTEFAAMQRAISEDPTLVSQVHVVRARGKGLLKLLAKILNKFKASYGLLHDADSPKRVDGSTNGMWTLNVELATLATENERQVRLVASLANFEQALFGSDVASDKPWVALEKLDEMPNGWETIRQLVRCLAGLDGLEKLPPNFVPWTSEDQLLAELEKAKTGAA